MKLSKLILSFAVLVTLTASCRKDIPESNRPDDYLRGDFASVFEGFWTGMNRNYIFWDMDPTDWDAVYTTYKSKFAELDINKDEDVVQGYNYFSNMTKDLIDGHYHIQISSDYAKILKREGYSDYINPSAARKAAQSGYQNHAPLYNYILTLLPITYLRGYFEVNSGFRAILGDIKNTAGKNIRYFYFSNFRFTSYLANGNVNINAILENFANILADPSLDGVIIDVRGNGGGYVNDLNILWGSLLMGKEFVGGYNRMKIGEGRLDYGPRIPFTIRPVKQLYETDIPTNPHPVTAPIVVLADANSASAAEISTMAISHLPNGYFVGETTWGGQGALSDYAPVVYGAGSFNNFFMSLVYTPFCIFECVNGKNYEGKGFSPKDAPRGYEVKYDKDAITAGRDPQLEKAIKIIMEN